METFYQNLSEFFLLINVKIDISFCLNHLTAHNLLSNLANLKKIG